ncbi:MAG: fucose isomerase [Oscillospiraceae bacterium]|nr:fucose isomerase [Oscillospiraceae bacterium]
MTFGVIVSTRSFFPSHLVKTARGEINAKLNELGHKAVMVGERDTEYGAVLTYDEAKTCAKLFQKHRDKISGIIVVLPNFGEELGVVEAIDMAGLDVPVLVQAYDDDFDKLDMANRRDAFCGKISVCNNLYQRGIKFTDTTTHTCKINSPEFTEDIKRFAAVCRVVGGLKGARIAMLGARPVAFNTVRFSEKILQKHKISVQTVDMSEIIFAAQSYNDTEKIAQKEAEIRAYGRIPESIEAEKITLQAKLCLVLEKFVDDLDCHASTVQCWDSVENNYGCAACLAMSMMGEKGRPSACESDVTGAVSMLAAQLAADNPAALMDWNNNIRDDRDTCIALHCSNFPKSFFNSSELEIGCLDVLGGVLGKDKCFGACKAQAAPGPMTFIRITTDDTRGIMKAYVGEGEFLAEHIPTKGGTANCRVEGLQELMKYICKNGFEHHVCFVRGHAADVLVEALENYMGIEVFRHK